MTRDGEILTKTSEEDAERRWVALMMKTAKKYHKLCPYFDKKTTQCLLMVTVEGRVGRCDRDGKYDGCPILVKFLDRLYRYYVERGRVLPRDFQDVVNQAFIAWEYVEYTGKRNLNAVIGGGLTLEVEV